MPTQLEERPTLATFETVEDRLRHGASLREAHEWSLLQTAATKPVILPIRPQPFQTNGGPSATRYWYAPDELNHRFEALARAWRAETEVLSSMHSIVLHPAYQRIIGLGRQVLPLILLELQVRPYHWFWALQAISGQDPAGPDATFNQRVVAWIDWGAENGYLI
jgi:hypothetical protein